MFLTEMIFLDAFTVPFSFFVDKNAFLGYSIYKQPRKERTPVLEINRIQINKIVSFFDSDVKTGEHRNVKRKCSGLVFAPNGKFIYRQNGEEYVSDPTHVLLLPEDGEYTIDCVKGDVCSLINFRCNFDKAKFVSFDVTDTAPYIEMYRKMRFEYYEKKDENKYHVCLSMIYDVLSTLEMSGRENRTEDFTKNAIRFMTENLGDASLSNEKIAASLNVSTVYFRKVFTERLGNPPMKYLRGMRVEKARELLRVPNANISEIAEKTGYSSVYSFSRVFSKECGMPPSKYAGMYKNAY